MLSRYISIFFYRREEEGKKLRKKKTNRQGNVDGNFAIR